MSKVREILMLHILLYQHDYTFILRRFRNAYSKLNRKLPSYAPNMYIPIREITKNDNSREYNVYILNFKHSLQIRIYIFITLCLCLGILHVYAKLNSNLSKIDRF